MSIWICIFFEATIDKSRKRFYKRDNKPKGRDMILERFLPDVLKKGPWINCLPELEEEIAQWVESELFTPFLNLIIEEVERVLTIDPGLKEHEILQEITAHMVKVLDAHSGSVRIFDPYTGQLLSYGSYPAEEAVREKYVSVSGTIAGEVLQTKRPYVVSDLLLDEKFKHKEIAYRKRAFSLLAIPFEIPRFYPSERETFGVIQIYFKEKGRKFSDLEILLATLIAKRLSFVMAKRKIYLLQKAREKREFISDMIISLCSGWR
jgi:GAF domain-containing protein